MKRLRFFVLLAACCLACRTNSQADRGAVGAVREPAVAGRFYPADAGTLRRAVETFLDDAAPSRIERPVALVVPHAGYLFSGPVAADGWRQVRGRPYDLVVLLGTNHTTPGFRGVAAFPGPAFRTPLGAAEADRDAAEALRAADPDVVFDAQVHDREHSIEVQIPFVQVLFPKAKILPLIVTPADPALCERLGKALGKVLAGRRALVVASSDLSHYPEETDAVAVDGKVLEAVARLDPGAVKAAIDAGMSRGIRGLDTCACGEAPILAAISAARALGATRGIVVGYATSADVPVGDASRVVGYGAVVFAGGPGGPDTRALAPLPTAAAAEALDPADRKALLAFARETIRRYLETGMVPPARGLPPRTLRPRGAFVTLNRDGQLRGCIGRMAPDLPLGRVVGAMALQAALNDPRFPPVGRDEVAHLSIEISVLTPMVPVAGPGDIVVGRDGVLLSKDGRSAVFLPQVATEQGWGRDEMLDHLCRKAGLSPGSWRQGAVIKVFRAEVFGEAEGR